MMAKAPQEPVGKISSGSLSAATIEFDCEGPVEREGRAVENDYARLLKVGGKEMWVHKDHPYDGGKLKVPMSFVLDNKMQVEGINMDQEEKLEHQPDSTVRQSLGPSTVFSSGTKAGDPDKKEKGQ